MIERQRLEVEGKRKAEEDKRREMAERAGKAAAAKVAALSAAGKVKIEEEPEEDLPKRGKTEARKPTLVPRRDEPRRRTTGKLTVSRVLNQGDEERMRSLASVRRAREKQRAHQLQALQEPTKIVRDVVVPETITVQELANRMAERGADVIKTLMGMGVMATINQAIDPDTAELVVTEMGHRPKRIAEGDVETGLTEAVDAPEALVSRPPVPVRSTVPS